MSDGVEVDITFRIKAQFCLGCGSIHLNALDVKAPTGMEDATLAELSTSITEHIIMNMLHDEDIGKAARERFGDDATYNEFLRQGAMATLPHLINSHGWITPTPPEEQAYREANAS